ncbi:MAG: hypothetical protein KC516_02995 [Nanoarchaeota archaeon]|nr:hypothetical protein [Nanoarchaeota archaeon]
MVNKKHVFFQALLLTIVVFIVGFYIGTLVEDRNLNKAESFFAQSEISLMDIVALNDFVDSGTLTCEELKKANFDFANKIYEEAQLLDKYEESGKFKDNLVFVHQKYDLLRSFLWMNAIKVKEKCGNDFSTVVYIYNYELEDLTIRAQQNVWSRILLDLKNSHDEDVLLIPIATSDDFVSLGALTSNLNISQYPVVIVNEKNVFYELTSVEDLESHLN